MFWRLYDFFLHGKNWCSNKLVWHPFVYNYPYINSEFAGGLRLSPPKLQHRSSQEWSRLKGPDHMQTIGYLACAKNVNIFRKNNFFLRVSRVRERTHSWWPLPDGVCSSSRIDMHHLAAVEGNSSDAWTLTSIVTLHIFCWVGGRQGERLGWQETPSSHQREGMLWGPTFHIYQFMH